MKSGPAIPAPRQRPSRGETPAAAFREESRCTQAVETLSLLANSRRLRILCALADRDLSVAEIVRAVNGRISGVSQQLKLLTLAGHLERRRVERSVIYRLADPRMRRILHFLKDQFPAS
jgi:DNA-binding transcriptional ArsR family regulator